MRRLIAGTPIYHQRPGRGVQRPRTWTPKHSGRYGWAVGKWVVWMTWERFLGYYATGAWLEGSGWPGTIREYPDMSRTRMKKPTATAAAAPDPGEPPPSSVPLKKYPRLLSFLHLRWYEDGSPRFPGSIWIDSDFVAFKAMLKEPSALLCARIRAASLDDLLAAVETFLGMESPPWEPDTYAMERAGKKSKK